MAEPDEPKKIEPDQEQEDGVKASAEPTEDPEVDSAVDDITRKEGDEELKAQDEAVGKPVVMKLGPTERLKNFLRNWWNNPRKRWLTILAVVVVIGGLGAVPFTRYEIAGLFMREQVTVQALDSQTGAPVSGAQVQMGAVEGETNSEGKAVLYPHAGRKQLQISKKYYRGNSQAVLVTLSPGSNVFKLKLAALGRQVQIKVVSKITNKPIENVKVMASGASAKTDKNGLATVVLPSGANTQAAIISLDGYNEAKVTIDANGNLAKDTFALTPAGKLYFLSNLSGTIDVVKTNLDGTGRQTVLAGTGSEDRGSTSLLASRDWKYLALLSKRSGDNASVYLIDTTNGDKLTTIDEGNADFSLVGWSGDRFVYQVTRHDVSDWQPNQEALKSFDPTTGHTLLLDQTQASGTNQYDSVKQQFNSTYLIGTQIVYTKGWTAGYNAYAQLGAKQAELDVINADGSSHRTVKTFSVGSGVQTSYVALGSRLYEPNGLYLAWYQGDGGNQYYDYEDGKVTQDTSMTDDQFNNTPYPTFLLSPSSNQTFWADQRDGKNTLFTGDDNAKNPKQIASLSDYNTYAWYTDDYLLVSKNSSELYIMPAAGGTPLKITDYYKPAINYQGYGGGYGGL